MERATGVEPATSSLGSWHSTTELRPLSPRVDGQMKSKELTQGCQRGFVLITARVGHLNRKHDHACADLPRRSASKSAGVILETSTQITPPS
jgi:hypothetical protein